MLGKIRKKFIKMFGILDFVRTFCSEFLSGIPSFRILTLEKIENDHVIFFSQNLRILKGISIKNFIKNLKELLIYIFHYKTKTILKYQPIL